MSKLRMLAVGRVVDGAVEIVAAPSEVAPKGHPEIAYLDRIVDELEAGLRVPTIRFTNDDYELLDKEN